MKMRRFRSNRNKKSSLPLGTGPGGAVIQIHSLSNIPDMDDGLRKDDVSDVYLTLQILTGEGEEYGPKQKTTVFNDVHDAIFGECYHTFRTPDDLEGVTLRVKAYDKDNFSKDEKIAHLDINLTDLKKAPRAENGEASATTFTNPILSKDRTFQTRKMEMDTKRRGQLSDEPVSVNLRLVPDEDLARCPPKRFFLIRHGESLWNEAQDNNDIMGLSKFDHALNGVGIEQCKKLNAAWREADSRALTLTPLEKEFISCPAIMCSPLTRCVQTALLSLHSHETLRSSGMTLQRNLREVKSTLGSLDTLGVEVGANDIKNRARDALLRVCDAAEKRGPPGRVGPPPLTESEIRTRVDPIELHANDTLSNWWTKGCTYDNEKNLRARMNAFMGTLRYTQSKSAILVGHSLFFRAIMKFYLSDGFEAEGTTREELSTCKMDNAAVVAIDVDFPPFPEEDNFFKISRVAFLFGSGLAKE